MVPPGFDPRTSRTLSDDPGCQANLCRWLANELVPIYFAWWRNRTLCILSFRDWPFMVLRGVRVKKRCMGARVRFLIRFIIASVPPHPITLFYERFLILISIDATISIRSVQHNLSYICPPVYIIMNVTYLVTYCQIIKIRRHQQNHTREQKFFRKIPTILILVLPFASAALQTLQLLK